MGEFILAQVKAKAKPIDPRLRRSEPITLYTLEGLPFRAWLAYDDKGNPKIGDARHWRLNCKKPEAIRPELDVVADHTQDRAAEFNPDGPTPGALQGDDYPLEYYEDGYPKLPPCLDRRPCKP